MSAISADRWQRASPHLDRLLDLTTTERDKYLEALGTEDPQIAGDVRALLTEHHLLTAEGFLASPPVIHPPDATLAGVSFGPYTLVSPIGHGGMGSVWLAERSDGRFTGRAAVKLLNAALLGRSAEKRFKREGTILARLTHPHIGRLIDAGLSGIGQPYLVLEYVDGRPIDRYCDEKQSSVDERIRLFLDVQAAVAHAHANLIVHRDLKPSNVLVTSDGQAARLRHREAARSRQGRPRCFKVDARRRRRDDAEVCGAGAADRRSDYHCDGRLRAWRRAVRASDRPASDRRRDTDVGGIRTGDHRPRATAAFSRRTSQEQ
jgi:serine/threonine protein kinase